MKREALPLTVGPRSPKYVAPEIEMKIRAPRPEFQFQFPRPARKLLYIGPCGHLPGPPTSPKTFAGGNTPRATRREEGEGLVIEQNQGQCHI